MYKVVVFLFDKTLIKLRFCYSSVLILYKNKIRSLLVVCDCFENWDFILVYFFEFAHWYFVSCAEFLKDKLAKSIIFGTLFAPKLRVTVFYFYIRLRLNCNKIGQFIKNRVSLRKNSKNIAKTVIICYNIIVLC